MAVPPRLVPVRLTAESIKGATEGTEQVSVPAGRFQATRVRFGSSGADQVWWLSDEVPGGVVRHAIAVGNGSDEPDQAQQMPIDDYVMELQDYGAGAESRLASSD